MTPLLTVNLLRVLFVTFCAAIGANISLAFGVNAWPGVVAGIAFGLVIFDRPPQGLSPRAFSSATFGLFLGMTAKSLIARTFCITNLKPPNG